MNKTILFTFIMLALLLPASGQEWAKTQLEKSPRHMEWVKVKDGNREVNCFVVYPQTKQKVMAILLVHEKFGLANWVRQEADELAAAGYIVIAPDLLSGEGPGGGGTAAIGGMDAAIKAVSQLPPNQVVSDLNAVAHYVTNLPSCDGKLVVLGFDWGGGQAFRYATVNPNLQAAFVFYGTPPAADAMKNVQCPVYGFYGDNDDRITPTVPKATKEMKAAGKIYESVTYEDAGHGFMRNGEAPGGLMGNRMARRTAWNRLTKLLAAVAAGKPLTGEAAK